MAAFADDAEDRRVGRREDPARGAREPAAATRLDDVPSDVRAVEDDAERVHRDEVPTDVETGWGRRPRLVLLGRATDQGGTPPDVDVAGRREMVSEERRTGPDEDVPRHGRVSARH